MPRNIYGVTKLAAEALCELVHRKDGLACILLRTSRFFPEEDDDKATRESYPDGNVKANEYLYRRVELSDAVQAHLLALEKAPIDRVWTLHHQRDDPVCSAGSRSAPERTRPRWSSGDSPIASTSSIRRGWKMFPSIGRVYVNERARRELVWKSPLRLPSCPGLSEEPDRDPMQPAGKRRCRIEGLPRPLRSVTGHTQSNELCGFRPLAARGNRHGVLGQL